LRVFSVKEYPVQGAVIPVSNSHREGKEKRDCDPDGDLRSPIDRAVTPESTSVFFVI
jgi:hypothetical protein